VYNVSLPLMKSLTPAQPFRLLELPVTSHEQAAADTASSLAGAAERG
jgi:hypothetical protein